MKTRNFIAAMAIMMAFGTTTAIAGTRVNNNRNDGRHTEVRGNQGHNQGNHNGNHFGQPCGHNSHGQYTGHGNNHNKCKNLFVCKRHRHGGVRGCRDCERMAYEARHHRCNHCHHCH